jgi:hypothetical protein
MSKVLQNISNGTQLRETNTDFLNKWLSKNQQRLRDFFDEVASPLPLEMMPVLTVPANLKLNNEDIQYIHSFL